MCEGKFKPKCVFLDLDGTIVDPRQAYVEAAQVGFQAIGQELPELRVILEIPKRMEQGLGFDDLVYGDVGRFKGAYLEAYHVSTEGKTRLLSNVVGAIEALSLRTKLVLLTMRHVQRQAVVKELDCFGIGKFFSLVMTAFDTVKPKPSPEAVFKGMEHVGIVDCGDCLIAGDSVNDIRAGKAAGIRTVGLLSGLYSQEELAKEGPDMILSDLTRLPEAIF